MSTILAVRGTNGSGKSTLVRKLMADLGKPVGKFAWDGRVSGYKFKYQDRTIFVVGMYKNECGGLDSSFSYKGAADGVCQVLRELAQHGYVVAEGVVGLSSYGVSRMVELAHNLANFGHQLTLATLDTPEDVCIERVKARRAGRGKTKPFNPANLQSKYRGIHKDHDRLAAEGVDCRKVSGDASLLNLLVSIRYMEQFQPS